MKKFNSKKLKRIYDIITAYTMNNSGMVIDTNYLLEYCLEKEIETCLKSYVGKVDDEVLHNIFNSLKLDFNVQPVKSSKAQNRLIKCNIAFTDIETFTENYSRITG